MSDTIPPLRVLHTSDWHLGANLYNHKRYEEFQAFLTWLEQTIKDQDIHVLLISGDIFDTTTPSNRSQELYYKFLYKVVNSCCRHVVIIGGNHDSPSFLNAPSSLLKAFHVHVIGSARDNLQEELILLSNANNEPELLVLAVPYLRDRDIRLGEAGESASDKESKMVTGIHKHYQELGALAQKQQNALGVHIPIIAMGHLFTAGGETIDGDGVRDLYVGSLGQVSTDIFTPKPDYVALGHLHVPQCVAGQADIRYSGSPLPMGFAEAQQQKSVCLIEFQGTTHTLSLINVPQFQELATVQGSFAEIESKILELKKLKRSIWLEVIYTGTEVISNLHEQIQELVQQTQLEVLRIKDTRLLESVLTPLGSNETLEEQNVTTIFQRLLTLKNIPEEQQKELITTYNEALQELYDQDAHAQ